MRLPISWLREFLEIELGPQEIALGLTQRGFKLESLEQVGHSYPGVVVARVLEVARHPKADRLTLCRVDSGRGEVRVVCGAPNVHPGMIAPLATVGAQLPDGTVLRKATIRGEESNGMLCSARELALSEDHEGIVSLPEMLGAEVVLRPGTPLDSVLGPPETVLDVEVFYNRGDCLSVIGLAREVAAFAGERWTEAGRKRRSGAWRATGGFDLGVEDPEGCPRYLAQVVENVSIQASPRWVQRRLEAMGMRAVNNVVDATNLTMLEFGQPLHAFDLDRLAGPAIRVRRARSGEPIHTLDGKARSLDPEILVIADRERPVAIAGIMGGEESEVSAATARILLECAVFDPQRVRRGVIQLGLASEASRRFEKGIDSETAPAATARFLDLLAELAPGSRPTASAEEHPRPHAAGVVSLRPPRCNDLLGVVLDKEEQARHLRSLGFRVEDRGAMLQVGPPSWRHDVACEEDLIEEVARAHGYDAIPEPAGELRAAPVTRSARERITAAARGALLSRGFQEAWSTSLVSEREARAVAELMGEADLTPKLSNPMSRESAALRPTPMVGLLRAVAHNLRQGQTSLRLFEVGVGFRTRAQDRPEERLMLAAALCGQRYAHAHDEAQSGVDFFEAKGIWEAVLDELRVDSAGWRDYPGSSWKPGASAQVAWTGSRIAWVGIAAPGWLRTWGIETPVHLFLLLLDPLLARSERTIRARLPERFPPVRRDVAFFLPESVAYADLHRILTREGGVELRRVELFDVYQGPGTPAGMRSLAWTLEFGHEERTLSESEVETIQQRMAAAVARECGGRLREK